MKTAKPSATKGGGKGIQSNWVREKKEFGPSD